MILALSMCCSWISAVARKSVTLVECLMRGPHHDRILASAALGLMLAAPLDAFAQDSNEPAATFNERFPADQTSTQPSLEIPETKKEQNATTTTRVVSAKHPRSRVVVAPRSFLDAGRQVLPGERMLRWRWSPILAGAWVGTIRRYRVRSFLSISCCEADDVFLVNFRMALIDI